MRKKKIITNNREIYDKLTMLHFAEEVVLRGVKQFQIDKILNTINKESNVLISEVLENELIIVRRNGPINFNIYFH